MSAGPDPGPRAVVTLLLLLTWVVFGLGEWLMVRTTRMQDGSPGLSVQDLQIRFQQDSRSLFEARIRTDMREHLDDAELNALVAWARTGADAEGYRRSVAAILDDRCLGCHRVGGVAGFRPLETLEQVRATVEAPPSPPLRAMITITKLHLVGIGALLAFPALVPRRSPSAARWRTAGVGMAYGGLLLDFGSWWAMRLDPAFAALRVAGHGLLWAGLAVLTAGALAASWLRREGAQ